jgi:hypothetical protein
MRIRVGRKSSTQDFADHGRPAGSGLALRPHRSLVNHFAIGAQVEPFSPADMLDQRLLYRVQCPPGHLGDHIRTLVIVIDVRSRLRDCRGTKA